MSERFRITLGQINPSAGDLSGNAALVREVWQTGRTAGAQLVALPEMCLTGIAGPLMRMPAFLRDVVAHVEALAADCADGPALAIGAPWPEGDNLYNAYLILQNGKIAQRVFKHRLAADERPLFDAGPISGPFAVAGLRIGSPIGADATAPDVAETLEETGAEILLVPNAAPYRRGIMDVRFNHMVARVIETGLPLIYLNQVGGQRANVFDGASFALNPGGRLLQQSPAFDPAVTHLDLERSTEGWHVVQGDIAQQPSEIERDYHALVVGLRDHLHKNGFARAVVELSDTNAAFVAVVAADALGPENLRCVLMPAADTTEEVRDIAKAFASKLGCTFDLVPISSMQHHMQETLEPFQRDGSLEDANAALTARLRGLTLQMLCDTMKALPLSTRTKTDLGRGPNVGGNLANGYAPIRDLYQTQINEVCRWRNEHHRVWMNGPASKAIDLSACGLSPDVEALDDILKILLDEHGTAEDCVAAGHERVKVKDVAECITRQLMNQISLTPGPQL